jgi:predicted ATPase/transcriptional regulator with XRE-family HTH domain
LDTTEETFGAWLRRRRRALDLTQQDLADCAGCSLVTVRKFEADERRPSKLLAELLADCLDVPAGEKERFVAFARQTDVATPLPPPLAAAQPASLPASPDPAAPGSTETTRPSSLPAPLTPLVGRETDVAALVALVERPGVRLVTMTGPGGTGKTRLAIEAARALAGAGRFPGGIWFVDLTAVTDPGLVLHEIAQVIGVKEQADVPMVDAIAGRLQSKQALLVLDNFEQVIAAAGELVALLSAANGLSLLVTSRELLRVYGEHEVPVGPLGLPPLHEGDPERLLHYPAVALFVQRSAAVRANFALTAENAPAVVEICRRLDGLPLAIELAAARSKLLNPPALLSQLGSSLDLSARVRHISERQRTLRGAIEWSYRLLDEEEQCFFRRLGVFAGTFAPADAASLMDDADEWVVTQTLAGLVDKSMIQPVETGGEPRFRLLVVLREYALEQLRAAAEWEATRDRHRRHFGEATAAVSRLMTGETLVNSIDRVASFYEELRAIMTDALEPGGPREQGVRIAVALPEYWKFKGMFQEGFFWLRQLMADLDEQATALRAAAHEALADLYANVGHAPESEEAARTSLELWQAVGGEDALRGEKHVLRILSAAALHRDDFAQSLAFDDQLLELETDPGAIAETLSNMALTEILAGRPHAARPYLDESMALQAQVRDPWALLFLLNNYGIVEYLEENYAAARARYEQAMEVGRQIGERFASSLAVANLAEVAHAEGDFAEARRILEQEFGTSAPELNGRTAYGIHSLGLLALSEGADPGVVWPLLAGPLRHWHGTGATRLLYRALHGVALLAARQGDLGSASRLLANIDARREDGTLRFIAPVLRPLRAEAQALVEAGLDDDSLRAARTDGYAMSIDQAVELALQAGQAVADASGSRRQASPKEPERRYVAERSLAEGGMGLVYLGHDATSGRVVVIKRLRPEIVKSDPTALARFRREAEVLRKVDHPAIVRVLHVSEEPPEIVMEYMPGGTLRDLLNREGMLPPARAAAIIRALAEALVVAHGFGIVHRDLKPENVLLAADGSPRLSDFGLAYRPSAETRLTEPDAVIGTVAYLSPEACHGQQPDARADLWALGVMLAEMLTGVHPFARDNAAATLLAIVDPKSDPIRGGEHIPPALTTLIRRLLAANPAERVPDARALLDELSALPLLP